jgi:hypothetical protein
MPEGGLRSAHFFEGYRITNTGTTLRIVVTSYQALPLELGPAEFAALGLRIETGGDGTPGAGGAPGQRVSCSARAGSAARPGRR